MAVLGVRRRPRAGRLLLAAAATLLLAAPTLAGCAGEADRARSAEARLSRAEGVGQARVEPPTGQQQARLAVAVDPDVTVERGGQVLAAVAEAAEKAGFGSYALEVTIADDALVGDERLVDEPGRAAVLRAWLELVDVLDASVVLDRSPAGNVVRVTSTELADDVAEAARVELPGPRTEWRFHADDGELALVGRPRVADAQAARLLPAAVTSPGVPLPAERWRLGRFDGGWQLDLWLPGATEPGSWMPRHDGDRVASLVRAALTALRPAPAVTVRLHRGDDLFGWWSTTGPAALGRDPLARGWDAWLRAQLLPSRRPLSPAGRVAAWDQPPGNAT